MTNKQLVDCVALKAGLTRKAAEEAVRAVFDVVAESLRTPEDVKLVGFGNFSVKKRPACVKRNPATGKEVKCPAKNVVKFKASKNLLGE